MLTVSTDIQRTGRVLQIEGMFDVPTAEKSVVQLDPAPLEAVIDDDSSWRIGLIVGPSGAGKSTLAAHVWPEQYATVNRAWEWPPDKSVLDGFPAELGIKDITGLLTSVGFSSPPAWLRPFRVLSTGEQFRVRLALALALKTDPVVMDEFTSTVDRQVAQIGSAAVAKAIRRREQRFIAVTCHHDVLDWLQPDWVYRPDSTDFEWRRLQPRPQVRLDVRPVGRELWRVFRHHHYLSGELHVAAKCVCAFHDGQPVAFTAYYRFPHPKAKDIMVSTRTVVLPDYQGIGIGQRLMAFVAERLHKDGWRNRATFAHPAMIAAFRASPQWREIAAPNRPSRSAKPKRLMKQHSSLRKFSTRTFEYVPPRVC